MKIGLVDVDGHNYPNLPLMKLSAWHKQRGDHVEWYSPIISGHMDRVYLSKVFSFTPDYEAVIDTDEVIRGGSGYCIQLENGIEVYHAERDKQLPPEIEHIYPDYSLYPEQTKNTAYGFLSRGCPRGCGFCHVAAKEGRRSVKVADLAEFWMGQEKIVICDPNILACPEWEDLLGQLADSGAVVDFNQGIDVRLATPDKIAALNKIRMDYLHLAWDNPEEDLEEQFRQFWGTVPQESAAGQNRLCADKLQQHIRTGFAQDLHLAGSEIQPVCDGLQQGKRGPGIQGSPKMGKQSADILHDRSL